jgi:HEAT repeat protein
MRATCVMAAAMLALQGGAWPLPGQPLAGRIAELADGHVTFRFASRPGICGDGYGMIGDGRGMHINNISSSRDVGSWRRRCEPGPVRVVLDVRGGRATSLRTFVGESARRAAGTDLGTVSVRDATDYLLGLAQTGGAAVSEDAILPAALADSVAIWPSLLRIARDGGRPRDAREQAGFWLSQFAAEKALGPDEEDDEPEDEDVADREQAVFALSQLDHNAGVPALVQIARSHSMPQVRRKAIFWLGQSGDGRALQLFEELLKGR